MSRVFISYVRENSNEVRRLVQALETRGVDVWFDQTHLLPGDRWAEVIQREIAQGDFFLACFSTEYTSRTQGFVFEELTQAVEHMRQRPPDQRWFIPVLLSACEVPNHSIGPGVTLHSIHWEELYRDWDAGIQRILRVVHPERVSTTMAEPPQDVPQESPESVAVAPIASEPAIALGASHQQVAPPEERAPDFTNTIGMEFGLIPAGKFHLGSTEGSAQETPVHEVTISQPFYLGKYAVTQGQWEAVMGNNPSRFTGDSHRPVERVSWDDVLAPDIRGRDLGFRLARSVALGP